MCLSVSLRDSLKMNALGNFLKSARLGFREYRDNDVVGMAQVFGDAYARRFYPEHGKDEKLRAWITWSQRNYAAHGFGLWAIELLSSGQFIGDAGLTIQPVEATNLLEVGYHVHPSFRGQGLATEAARTCLNWAFENTLHSTVCSIVHPENVASIRVAEKVHSLKRTVQGNSGPSLLFYTTREIWSGEALPKDKR
jgi:RimJ/RimL family protein N-acetyltransferase